MSSNVGYIHSETAHGTVISSCIHCVNPGSLSSLMERNRTGKPKRMNSTIDPFFLSEEERHSTGDPKGMDSTIDPFFGFEHAVHARDCCQCNNLNYRTLQCSSASKEVAAARPSFAAENSSVSPGQRAKQNPNEENVLIEAIDCPRQQEKVSTPDLQQCQPQASKVTNSVYRCTRGCRLSKLNSAVPLDSPRGYSPGNLDEFFDFSAGHTDDEALGEYRTEQVNVKYTFTLDAVL